MVTQKAFRFRAVYGYTVAGCAALVVVGAISTTPMPSFVSALDQTGRDSQLPLERFFVDAAHAPISSLKARREPQNRFPPRLFRSVAQTSRPSDLVEQRSAYTNHSRADEHYGVVSLDMPQTKISAHLYTRKIKDWKNWT